MPFEPRLYIQPQRWACRIPLPEMSEAQVHRVAFWVEYATRLRYAAHRPRAWVVPCQDSPYFDVVVELFALHDPDEAYAHIRETAAYWAYQVRYPRAF